jgi:hypothetical protein
LTGYGHRNFSCDIINVPFKTLLGILGYWALLFKASSRSTCLQGLPEVSPDKLLAAKLGNLGAPTLRSIKTMTQFFFFFWSIKPAMLSASMLGDYSTSASSTPSCFYHRIDLLGNPFLITLLLDPFSSSLLFWTIILAILPAMMLGYYS